MKTEKDLTVGKIPTQLIKFALPLLFVNIFQALYNMVDMIVVGQFVGKTGVAAISNASSIVFVLNAVCTGVTMGGTVLIAKYKGANNKEGQKSTVGTMYSISAVAAILITVAGFSACRPLLAAMNVPTEAMQEAVEYMTVIFLGTFFVFGYNATCAILRGFGDSVRPLIFVTIATVINIVLDYIFVGVLDMGTVGAAYATVIAQGVSFLISIAYLKLQKFIFDFKLKSFAVKKDKLFAILKISMPTAIQMTAVNLSYLIMGVMLNKYGVTIAAAAGIGLKINTFSAMPIWAIGQAMTAMVGQNVGARLIERTEKIGRIGLRITIIVSLVVVGLIQLLAKPFVMLFDSSNLEVIDSAVRYLRICRSVISLVYAVMYGLNSFAIGVGDAKIAMAGALLDAVIIRLPLCWLLSSVIMQSYEGIYWAQILSPIIPAIIIVIYFYRKKWKKKLNSNANLSEHQGG